MGRQNIDEMTQTPGKGSEVQEYIFSELRPMIEMLFDKLEKKADNDELVFTQSMMAKLSDTKEIIKNLNMLVSSVDSLKDSLKALTLKLDSEDVVNMDSDYQLSINNLIK